MKQLTVPERDKRGLETLLSLGVGQMAALSDVLNGSPPALDIEELAPRVGEALHISAQSAATVLKVLAGLYSTQSRKRFARSLDEFVREVERAASAAVDVMPAIGWEAFREHLKPLLSSSSFYVTTRALGVAREHQHVMCAPRVITDLRPVFDGEDQPAAAIVSHSLRIKYHDGGGWGPLLEFYISLSSEDVEELADMLERAKRKEANLRSALGTSIPFPLLKSKSH